MTGCSRHLQHDRCGTERASHYGLPLRHELAPISSPVPLISFSTPKPPITAENLPASVLQDKIMFCSCPGGTAQYSIPVLPQRARKHLGQGLLRPISRPNRKQNVTFAAKKVSRHSNFEGKEPAQLSRPILRRPMKGIAAVRKGCACKDTLASYSSLQYLAAILRHHQ